MSDEYIIIKKKDDSSGVAMAFLIIVGIALALIVVVISPGVLIVSLFSQGALGTGAMWCWSIIAAAAYFFGMVFLAKTDIDKKRSNGQSTTETNSEQTHWKLGTSYYFITCGILTVIYAVAYFGFDAQFPQKHLSYLFVSIEDRDPIKKAIEFGRDLHSEMEELNRSRYGSDEHLHEISKIRRNVAEYVKTLNDREKERFNKALELATQGNSADTIKEMVPR